MAALGITILLVMALFGLGGLIGLGVWIWRRAKREPILLTEPLDIGAVISGMVAPFAGGGLPLIALAIVFVGLPRLLSGRLLANAVLATRQPLSPGAPAAFATIYGSSLLVAIIGMIFHIAAIRVLVMRGTGRDDDLREALGKVPGLMLPVIGIFILSVLGGIFGAFFLLWPAILLLLTLSVVMPVAVVEEAGVIGSMRRSHALTVGSRGRILLAYLVFAVLGGAVFGIVAAIQHVVGGILSIAGLVAQAVMSVVLALFSVGLVSSLYVKLLEIHGGAGRGDLADIFS